MIRGDYINLLWIASKTEKCYFTTSIKFSCLPQSYKKPFYTKYNFEISLLDKFDKSHIEMRVRNWQRNPIILYHLIFISSKLMLIG